MHTILPLPTKVYYAPWPYDGGPNWRLWIVCTMIEIDEDLCKGCNICISFCPLKVLETSDKINRKGYYVPVAVNEDDCVGCRLCELLCPEFAIMVVNE